VEIKDWKVRSPPNLLPHTLPNLRYKIRQKATYFLADEPQGIIDLSAVSVMKALGSRWKLKSEKSAHCQIYHTNYQIFDTKYAQKQCTPSLMSHEALLIFLPGLWLRRWASGGNWSLTSRLTVSFTTQTTKFTIRNTPKSNVLPHWWATRHYWSFCRVCD